MTSVINHAGNAGRSNVSQMEGFQKSSKNKVSSQFSQEQSSSMSESSSNDRGESTGYYDSYLWFGSRGNSGRYPY